MYFEFQISTNIFGRIIRNRLRKIDSCIDYGFDIAGQKVVIDRIEVGSQSIFQRGQGIESTVMVQLIGNTGFIDTNSMQLKQSIEVFLVKNSELEGSRVNPSPVFQQVTIFPIFDLNLSKDTVGNAVLNYSFSSIDFGVLSDLLSQQVKEQITSLVQGNIKLSPVILDLKTLSSLLKGPVLVTNAGISCDSNGSL